VLKATLNHCKNITLDIDASEVIANKADGSITTWGGLKYGGKNAPNVPTDNIFGMGCAPM
jgi:hypothetical protein